MQFYYIFYVNKTQFVKFNKIFDQCTYDYSTKRINILRICQYEIKQNKYKSIEKCRPKTLPTPAFAPAGFYFRFCRL